MTNKPIITIVSPCYNEEMNVEELYKRVKAAVEPLNDIYTFELLLIDNCSTDSTVEKIKSIIESDKSVKLIVNTRNFGHIRSPYYGILQSRGVATIYLASDLQDPPELIPDFIEAWKRGYKVVMASKPVSYDNKFMFALRRLYYSFVDLISEAPLVRDATGFGLYDQCVIDQLRMINDPYPFLRALIAELGYPTKIINFIQPRRMRGVSKNNIYTLYDIAWLGMASHSKIPLRIASLLGLIVGAGSIIVAFIYLMLKLVFWNKFAMGLSPILIGMFFLFGIQFFLIGILGEYIAIITSYLQKRPIVVEAERINFDENDNSNPGEIK
jgi:glycosyltransferase involved in cell wall biosynthesis